jgi:hypothetical protein
MVWTGDEISDLNPPGHDQHISKIERVARSAQVSFEILADVANEIERREVPHVAALFQLPFPVSAGAGWHRVATGTQGVRAEIQTEVCQVEMVSLDQFRLVRNGAQKPGAPLVTQVVALFPLWQPRVQFYGKYLTHALDPRRSDAIIVPQGPSWIDNRPISTTAFGHDIAKRLLREVNPILRSFLPAYSIAAIMEVPIPARVYGYMAMTAPGRVMFAGESVSVVGGLLDRLAGSPSVEPIDSESLSAAMRNRYREFGAFEAQLFALERLRVQGEVTLALIGTLSLVEWVLNRHLVGGGGKERNLVALIKDERVTFLTEREKELIDSARRARNAAVHGEPPSRSSLVTGSSAAGRELYGLSARITAADVREVIQLALKAYRAVNLAERKVAG